MRWLFLFVLSLNLVYIGLEMSQSSSADYADVPPLKNVETIVLLSELKSSPDLAVTELAAVEEGGAEDVLVKDLPDEPVNIEPDVAPGTESGQVVAEQKAVDSGSTEASGSEQPAARSEGQAEEILEKAAVPAEPVAETVAVVTPASAGQDPSADTSQVAPAQSAGCFTLGPFRDLASLRGLTREIKTYVVNADFRGREEKELALYWVYLKPEKNRKQAIKTGKRLKAKKIKDFYVIRDGEKINGLSLGHFRSKKGAYRLARKVKKLGFDVVVEPVFRSYTIYWLDYQLVDGAAIPEPVLEKYTRSGKKEKITRLSRDCSG